MKLHSIILIVFITVGVSGEVFSEPFIEGSNKARFGEENIKREFKSYEHIIEEQIYKLSEFIKESLDSGGEEDPEIIERINFLNRELAGVKAKLADTDKALANREKVLKQAEYALESERLKNSISQDQRNLARFDLEGGDDSRVEGLLSQFLEKRKIRDDPWAEVAFALGKLAQDRVDYHTAQKYFTMAAELAPSNGLYLNQAGFLAHFLGDYSTAIIYFEKALDAYLIKFGPQHTYVATSLGNLGEAWRKKGDDDKAIDYLEKASSFMKILGPDHPDVINNWNNLGLAWDHKGNYEKAIDCFEQALASNLKNFGLNHPNVATNWNNLGLAWGHRGEHDLAIFYYEKAIESNINTFGPESSNVATNLNNLAGVLENKGEYDKAIGYFNRVLEVYEKAGYLRKVQLIKNRIAKLKKLAGDP